MIQNEEVEHLLVGPIVFAASNDPDTVYYHQAMKELDQKKFMKAIVTKMNGHVEGDHWKLVKRADVPKGTKILDSAWAFKRKRSIKNCEVLKYKMRLNVHGGQQLYGMHYFNTYVTVVTWSSVRLVLILSVINQWNTHQINFFMTYLHADIKCNLYMKLPFGVEAVDDIGDRYMLKLKKIYMGRSRLEESGMST
eukprot:7665954-Ditylum_brightwellii.AAC.1